MDREIPTPSPFLWSSGTSGVLILILSVVSLFVVTVLVLVRVTVKRHVKSEEEIFSRQTQHTDWDLMKGSTHLGDDIGDNFLTEAKTANIYQTEDIFQLAETTGPAGRVFLSQFRTVPEWVNMDLVRRGSEFQRRWIEVYFGSALGAIVESYGYSNGAKILVETGRLTCGMTDTRRRLLETAVFNYDLIYYGLHDTDSPAFELIARVRLLHCLVRRHVRQACPWWDESTMGIPVSQEDGAHTIFLNSHVAIRGMENQWLPISEEEKEAVSMFWSYCGYLLGIDGRYLPQSYSQERIMYETIFDHSFHPSSQSIKLTQSTLSSSSGLPPYYFTFSQQAALVRLSLGPKISDKLCVPQTRSWREYSLITLIRIVTLVKWIVFSVTGRKFDLHSGPQLRKFISESLILYGKGEPKWRFFLARKKDNIN